MRTRFPIRFKILITMLFVVTMVVGLIMVTMVRLFNEDKTAYVRDLTSVIALHTAEETHSLLVGYRERLQVFARIMHERGLPQKQKVSLLKQLFEDFQEFVAVTLYIIDAKPVTVFDAQSFGDANLDKQAIFDFRQKHPLPMDRIRAGEVFIQNSTLTEQLPTLTLAVAAAQTEGDQEQATVVAAVIRLDSLQRLAKRSEVFETYVIDTRGVLLAHSKTDLVTQRKNVDWLPELENLQQQQTLGTTLEYDYNGVPVVGGFARVEFGGLLAGVQIPKAAAYLTARELLYNLIGVSLALLLIAALISMVWSRRITRPIELLSRASEKVGRGQFNIKLNLKSQDEIGDLATSFNQMATELHAREQALEQAQAALVQSEKMSAFGQISAGIAHEVKNPLAGILGYAQLSKRKLDKDDPLYKNVEIIEKETKRCKEIIENLMKFSRREKVEKELTDINKVAQDAIAIVDHQLTINQVKLEQDLEADLCPLMADGNQLQQVLMNFMINAQQAMDGNPGIVRIATRKLSLEHIEVRVSDNGPGMPEDVSAKIFEPFFTTKPAGKGTGLGLSVSYGIIQDHKGEIRVDSAPGKGTTFIVTLPVAQMGDALQSMDEAAAG